MKKTCSDLLSAEEKINEQTFGVLGWPSGVSFSGLPRDKPS